MSGESPIRTLMVVFMVALVCSILVSVSAIGLRPIQLQNELIERYRNIVLLTGLAEEGQALSDADILSVVEQLDVRVVNLDTGAFEPDLDPDDVNARSAVNDPARSTEIATEEDLARLGRRAIHEVVYLVRVEDRIERVILPIHGQGMWSTLYGYLALESDLKTIAAVTFYEHTETAGLGDQIVDASWQAKWQGREMFGSGGDVQFRVATGLVDPDSRAARHEVDAISGATVTTNAVTSLIRYWFGPSGYGPFLDNLANERSGAH